MQRAGSEIERPWIQEQEAALPRRNHGQLRKADIIAYRQRNLAIRRKIHQGQLIPRRQNIRFPERDLPRDIDVEQMHLPMRRQQLALWIKQQRRVVVLVRLGHELWDAAAEEVGFCLRGEGGERVEGGGLGGGGRAGEEGFGVGGEVLAAVGRVEAFGEDDERGAGAGGFENAGARSGEVGGFVGACGGVGC